MIDALRWAKVPCVYILANERHTVLYIGVTGDLKARVYQHREKLLSGFATTFSSLFTTRSPPKWRPRSPVRSNSKQGHAKRKSI
jgi:hypothetical protein